MREGKGYVVCLLKYMLGAGAGDPRNLDRQSSNQKPVCLGYFGRADVVSVSRFKDYMEIASENDIEFIGSRKQLLLYPFGGKIANQIELAEKKETHGLPFRPADGNHSRPCFCCLSILNINQSLKDRMESEGIRDIAQCLSNQIAQCAAQPGVPQLDYAVMGLLGTEDICVILLSDDFPCIAQIIEHLRSLADRRSGELLIQNSHSVLMVDYSGNAQPPKWGNTRAEIHFSLKTSDGLAYLQKVQQTMDERLGHMATVLENQVGEYDVAIHCPASVLGGYLYGYQESLNYINADYRSAVYQSETTLYQEVTPSAFIRTEVELPGVDEASEELTAQLPLDGMAEFVSEAIRNINQCMLGTQDDPNNALRYIRLGLFRLLKDFMRIASIPFGRTFQCDLCLQFRASVNAIVFAAEQYKIAKQFGKEAKSEFDKTFSQIVNALSNSMQAASQVDRLSFEEQQSHLQNTGAYHKVLLAYYGIVKDILTLLYSIDRCDGSEQPMLIPLLSFGHTPTIFSEPYHLYYDEKPAKLICITLPYQALTNVPKHIGPLVHELFHYSSPANRELRNEAAGKFLVAVALQQFFDGVGSASPGGRGRSGQDAFVYYQGKFLSVVDQVYGIIRQNQSLRSAGRIPRIGAGPMDGNERALDSTEFFRTIRSALVPPSDDTTGEWVQQLYCEAWMELRRELLDEPRINGGVISLLCLDRTFSEAEARAHIEGIYQKILPDLQPAVEARLISYERALCEIPPDLFDISFVMYGRTNDQKAQQYLWQIHGIRCDKLYYNAQPRRESDHITTRIGVILDYLVFGLCDADQFGSFSERSRLIEDKLKQWYGGDDSPSSWQKSEQGQIRRSISDDYAVYHASSLTANIMLKSYMEPIEQQIDALGRKEAMVQIMQQLSDFYAQYYTALEDESKDCCTAALFDLAIRIVEHYQKQPRLDELGLECCRLEPAKRADVPPPAPKPEKTVPSFKWKCEAMAYHPKDLSTQIVESYNIMMPEGSSAPLWFRGQKSAEWNLLPGVMRSEEKLFTKYGFLSGMRKMLTLAKAKILPRGETFHDAEWLAFLQHNDFKTNLLDWSEDLHSALFFAIKSWMVSTEEEPKKDASISVFNPVLFNLAQDMLEKHRKKENGEESKEAFEQSLRRLGVYLKGGTDGSGKYAIPLFTRSEDNTLYEKYFDLNISNVVDEKDISLPIAAMTPVNSERMKMQAGVFLFFDVRSKPEEKAGALSYEKYDLSNIQQKYFQVVSEEAESRNGFPASRPFLYKIILNRRNWKDFSKYARAIGIRKYKMYPEIDKLAGDITEQAFDGGPGRN